MVVEKYKITLGDVYKGYMNQFNVMIRLVIHALSICIHFKDQSIRSQTPDKRVTHAAKVMVYAFKPSTQEARGSWDL